MAFIAAAAPYIAVAATAAGITVMQVMGMREEAKAQAAMYKYNAEVARRDAAAKRRASLEEQQIKREEMRRRLKTQRAQFAKAGFVGSPMEVQLQTIETMVADISTLRYTRETEARRFESQAAIEMFKRKAAIKAGKIGVGTALFKGIGDIAMMGIKQKLTEQGKV